MTVLEEQFRSADIGEAEAYIRRSYGKVELFADDVVISESSAGDERFSLRRLDIQGGFRASCDLEAVVAVQSDDSYMWEVDGVRGTAREPVLFQPGAFACRLDDVRARAIVLPVHVLTDVARTVYNDDAVTATFAGASASSPARARAWLSALRMAFEAETLLDNELVRASVFRAVAVSTLETFAMLGDCRARRTTVAQQQRAYRTAIAFFEDHASLPITIDDAAAAAGVSTEALARAFRTHSAGGRSPGEHLRAIRLDAAHADLLRAPLDGSTTAADIAARWGFREATFKSEHARVYGTRPQDILGS